MKRLIVNGDPGLRKGARIDYDGEEYICFSITRNGDYHGPSQVQLWCTIGTEAEREDFERRNFIPHFLDTETVAADTIEVLEQSAETAQ